MWLREDKQPQGTSEEMGRRREGGASMVSTALGIARTLPPHGPGPAGKEDVPISISPLFFLQGQTNLTAVANPSHLEIVRCFLQNHVPGVETFDCAVLCLILHSRIPDPSSPSKSCS